MALLDQLYTYHISHFASILEIHTMKYETLTVHFHISFKFCVLFKKSFDFSRKCWPWCKMLWNVKYRKRGTKCKIPSYTLFLHFVNIFAYFAMCIVSLTWSVPRRMFKMQYDSTMISTIRQGKTVGGAYSMWLMTCYSDDTNKCEYCNCGDRRRLPPEHKKNSRNIECDTVVSKPNFTRAPWSPLFIKDVSNAIYKFLNAIPGPEFGKTITEKWVNHMLQCVATDDRYLKKETSYSDLE